MRVAESANTSEFQAKRKCLNSQQLSFPFGPGLLYKNTECKHD